MSLTVLDPATEQPIAELEQAGLEETDAAVARAKAAFPAWRAVAPRDRGRLLRRLATLVEEHGEELARIESRNVGKPIAGARAEVGMVADVLHFYAGAVDKHHGETIPVAGGMDAVFREPLGVVGLIVPWNFPLNIASWKLGPALACGNTVVLKPAALTPLSALRLGELVLEAGIPEGVVNVLVGPGSVVGGRLVEHPDVAKIGFTGSTEVGAEVMRGAAGTIKRVTLELGGKSANVVFADADLERAAATAPYAVFDNAGQDCCARSRILVERPAYDRFADLLVEATRGVKVGDPADEATEMGPLISAAHRETVASFVEGEPLFRGETPAGSGYWYPCTIVEASNEDRIAREEVFGPVAALIPFDDEADAIRIANDTPYGLSGSIWTRDGARAIRVARALETGVLSVNSNSSVRPTTPFGGFKQSGFGRELGMHAMDGYSEIKNVFFSFGMTAELLAAYDAQLRARTSERLPEGVSVERDGPLVRVLGFGDGGFVGYRDLGGLEGAELDELIARQVRLFAERGEPFEWKLHGHDRPVDLADRLRAAGFVPEAQETVVIAPVDAVAGEPLLPDDVSLREVAERSDFDRIQAMESAIWGDDRTWLAESLESERAADPDAIAIVVAEAGSAVVCAGWVRYEGGTDFATLWGGGTLPEWRGRGIYRATVAYRASLAATRGFRYLEVDASDDSRPILERLGFVAVTTTTPFIRSADR